MSSVELKEHIPISEKSLTDSDQLWECLTADISSFQFPLLILLLVK